MNVNNPQTAQMSHQRRNALYSAYAIIAVMAIALVSTIWLGVTEGPPAILVTTLVFGAVLAVWGGTVLLIRRGRIEQGVMLGLVALLVLIPLNQLVGSGRGIGTGLALGVGGVIIAGVCLPFARARWFFAGAALSGLACILLDLYGSPTRIQSESLNRIAQILQFSVIAVFVVILLIEFRNFSLRSKLIAAFVGLAVLSTLGITFVATQAIRNTLTANVANDLRTRAQTTALAIGLTMDRNVDRVQTMSLDKRVQDEMTLIMDSYPADAQARERLVERNAATWQSADPQDGLIRNILNGPLAYSLRQFGSVFQGNKELLMTDATGSTVAATDWRPTFNYRDEEWWKIAYNNGRGSVYVGQPEFNPMINEYGVRIAMPVYAPGERRAVGVVQSIFTFTALQRALLLNRFGESGKVDLLFPQGQILTSEGTFRALTNEEFSEIKQGILQPLAKLQYRGTTLLSGQGVIGVSDEQPEPYLRSSAWRTIATVQEQEALGAIEAGAQAALLAGIATIVAAILVALLLAQFLTRPIRRLTTAAEQVQAGDLTARAPVETSDEIGTLAQTFNSMTARLQDTLSGLEQRVSARTQELSQANLTLQSNSAYLSALSDTSTGLFARLNVKELLQAVVERAGALVGTGNGFVFFAEPDENEIEMRVGSGLYDDLVGTRAQPGVGLAGSVWQNGEAMVIDDYQKWEGRLPGSRRDALHSIVAVPLKRGSGVGNADDETLGVIGLAYTDAERKFGKSEVEILQRFAQLASIALDNARLYADSENRVQELGALNSVSQIIAEETELAPLIEKIGDQVCHIFDTNFTYIALVDNAHQKIDFAYVRDEGERAELDSLKLGEGITSQVISTRQPLLLASANEADYARLGALDSGDGSTPTSLLTVPLTSGDNAIGVISVQRTGQARNFTLDDQRLLMTIASTVAVGIGNAQLTEATKKRVSELTSLNRISALLNSTESLDQRLKQVGRELVSAFNFSTAYICIPDAARQTLYTPFFVENGVEQEIPPRPFGSGFVRHIVDTRAPLLINENLAERFEELGAVWIGDDYGVKPQSYLGVPIQTGDSVYGAIGLSAIPAGYFIDADMQFLGTIAPTIAQAIQSSQLLEQTQERAREMDAVNSLAREITQQRSLDDLFKEVYLQVKSVSSAEGFIVSLHDERTDSLSVPFVMDEGTRYEITPDALAMEREYADQVKRGEPVMINSTPEEVAELEKSPAVAGGGRASRSRLYVPLMAGIRFLGMISLHSYEYNAYSERDVSVLNGLASHIAIALENARLFEQTQQALSQTERLYRIAETANVETDETKFYARLHEQVAQAMPAKNFFIALYNEYEHVLDMPYFVDERDVLPALPQLRVNVGKGTTAYVLRTRQPLLATVERLKVLEAQGELERQGTDPVSWLGVPLMRGETAIGVMTVQSYDPAFFYTERDKETLLNLSQGIANSIERKRAEKALRVESRLNAASAEIARVLESSMDTRAALQASAQISYQELDAAFVRIWTLNEQTNVLEMQASAGQYTHLNGAHGRVPVGKFKIGMIAQEKKPHLTNQVVGDERVGDQAWAQREGMVAFAGYPILIADRVLGVMALFARHPLEQRVLDALRRYSDLLAQFIDRKRTEDELHTVLLRERQSAEQVTALNRRLTREGWRDYLSQMSSGIVVEAGSGEDGNGHAGAYSGGATRPPNGESGDVNFVEPAAPEKIRVPIQLRGEVIGEIELEPDEARNSLGAEDLGLVTHVAENIGLALDNARLFSETQRRVTELDALNHISQAVTTELDINTLLDLIGTQLREIFRVQNSYIALYDRKNEIITLPYFVEEGQLLTVEPLRFGEGVTSHIIRIREPLVLNRNTADEMAALGSKVVGKPARSFLGVPIFVGEEVTGVISVQSTEREDLFDEGNVRLLETIAATVGAAIQNAQLYSAMQQEVVERQRAEEEIKLSLREKEVLLKEIHHRVKNNLQIITSLLNLQSAQIKDPEALVIFRESQARVRSMALIHEKLYQSKDLARIDFDGYLRDLMVYLFRSYAANPEHIRPHLNANNMFLAIDTAIPCGLIISELVTNTIKYAFPNGKRGNLHISVGPEDDGHLTLLVQDDGVGFPEGFDWRESDSLGLQLVSTLTSQLHGTIQVDGRNGTMFKITFPG